MFGVFGGRNIYGYELVEYDDIILEITIRR